MKSGREDPVLIAGAGLAALACALELAPCPVIVLSPTPLGEGAASNWAQGGIAAAIGEGDDASQHLNDTISAGAGLVDHARANVLTSGAGEAIRFLQDKGVVFDKGSDGTLALGREAAHGRHRIVHIDGDATGAGVMKVLVERVLSSAHIEVLEDARLVDLVKQDDTVCGGIIEHDGQRTVIPARAVVMATGGIGGLYSRTTSPPQILGQGHGIAARAGAEMADMEFVQFHPTAMDVGLDPAPLATEALRGQGAELVNDRGERIMLGVHPDLELAPRDVIARTIYRQMHLGRRVFLDCREAIGTGFAKRFPTVYAAARDAGIDPARDLLPIAPAAHYHMGGIGADENGRTSLTGLWACGEVASTGVHGANRLASNSLLEGLVFGRRTARDILAKALPPAKLLLNHTEDPLPAGSAADLEKIRQIMFECAGVVRDRAHLKQGAREVLDILRKTDGSAVGLSATTAFMVLVSALVREESLGGHFRSDMPVHKTGGQRSNMTLDQAVSISEDIENAAQKDKRTRPA